MLDNNPRKNRARAQWKKTNRVIGERPPPPPSHQKSNGPSIRYLLHYSKMKWISCRVYMQDNLDYKTSSKNKYLRPFSMLPSLLKRIHTNMSVVPRLLYTGTKGCPELVFSSGMKTSINSFRNDSFRIVLFWYHVATGINSFLNKTHSDIV